MVPTLVAGTVGASILFGSEEQSASCSPELCYIDSAGVYCRHLLMVVMRSVVVVNTTLVRS